MTATDPTPKINFESYDTPNLLRLSNDHPRIEEIFHMRKTYALENGWTQANDPDYYDLMPGTVTLATEDDFGDFRSSLRLTYLGSDVDAVLENCLSLKMIDDSADERSSVAAALLSPGILSVDDTVYDMTRFVVDKSKYPSDLRGFHDTLKDDFLRMIGGAVAATDARALDEDTAVWLFTAEPAMLALLKRHDIKPTLIHEQLNKEGVLLQFCAVRPAKSFSEVSAGNSQEARVAKLAISLGQQASSV